MIFICTFDPFGMGKYRYCFEEWCEKVELPLNDGTHKIFLNSKGNDSEDVPKELISFLRYVCNSTEEVVEASEDKLLRKLHEKVNGIKRDGEKEVQYMTVQDWMDDMYFEGKQEGKTQERQQMLALITAMSQDGRASEIPRLSAEEAFFLEMQKKYQLQ